MFGLTRVGTQPLIHYHNELDPFLPGWFFPEAKTGGLNAWEDGDNVFVEAEVPGLKMNEIQVTVTGDELTIHGERKESKDGGRYRRAISYTRTFSLPEGINAEKAAAALEDGILTVTLPKAEAVKPRRIEVAVKK